MSRSGHRWRRGIQLAVLPLLALCLALATFVQSQQWLLRWRAERLLADIRAIQMGKSTWADAQRLMDRWGAWGAWDGACTAEDCEYQIALRDVSHALPIQFWTRAHFIERSAGHVYKLWALRLYWFLGGRVAETYASVRVKNGIIWTKSFSVYTPRTLMSEGIDDFLIGYADGATKFTPHGLSEGLDQHPEYVVNAAGPCEGCSGSCTVCVLIRAKFTPFADGAIVDQLFDFNLGCISSWRQCYKPSEIMPSAWRLYRQGSSVGYRGYSDWGNCTVPVEAIARDHRYALQTRVESVKAVRGSDGRIDYEASLHAVANLRNDPMQGRKSIDKQLKRVFLGFSNSVLAGGVRVSTINAGDGIIYFFNQLPSLDAIGLGDGRCSYVPDTEQNRAAARKGIARDVLADFPEE